jgi:hypothetical protein
LQREVHEKSGVQWMWCLLMMMAPFIWMCCWVPFLVVPCEDIRFECSYCHKTVRRHYAPCCGI